MPPPSWVRIRGVEGGWCGGWAWIRVGFVSNILRDYCDYGLFWVALCYCGDYGQIWIGDGRRISHILVSLRLDRE